MRRPRSSGQALVEFALVAPLFFLLLFGVVEYALINASIGSYNFAAKDAARFGAIVGEASAQSIPTTPSPTLIPTDTYIVNNIILPRVQGVVMATGTEIEIYNSDETGACVMIATSTGSVCQEDIFQPSSSGVWSSTNGGAAKGGIWPYTSRLDTLANADYLGVKIHYTYTYLTAFFATTSPTISLTAISIQRIEPQQYGDQYDPGKNIWALSNPVWSYLTQASAYWERRSATYLKRLAGGRA